MNVSPSNSSHDCAFTTEDSSENSLDVKEQKTRKKTERTMRHFCEYYETQPYPCANKIVEMNRCTKWWCENRRYKHLPILSEVAITIVKCYFIPCLPLFALTEDRSEIDCCPFEICREVYRYHDYPDYTPDGCCFEPVNLDE